MHSVIECKDIIKIFKVKKGNPHEYFFKQKVQEIIALKNITFSVAKGEILGVIGANGSGKSTLLKLLSRITSPTSGEIVLKGRTLSLLEVGTGFHPELTGRENIFLNGSIVGMKKNEIENRLEEIIEFSGIKEFIDIPVKKYSSGMYVRLAFSIIAHMEPDILLIDEILSVGDLDFQKRSIEHMRKLASNKNITIILVSHNLDIIQSLSSSCIWLNKGVIRRIGQASSIVNEYIDDKEQHSHFPISAREDRIGNGKAIVTKIEILDREGKNIDFVYAGQDAHFLISYKVFDSDIKSLDFAFPINSTSLHGRIANIYSKTIKKSLAIESGEGKIELVIKNLPLNIGRYSFNVWLGHEGEVFDNVMNAGSFNVLFGDYYKTGLLPPADHGILLLDYEIY